jgi:hypothetical protein
MMTVYFFGCYGSTYWGPTDKRDDDSFNKLPTVKESNTLDIKSNIQFGKDDLKELEAELKQSILIFKLLMKMQTSQN